MVSLSNALVDIQAAGIGPGMARQTRIRPATTPTGICCDLLAIGICSRDRERLPTSVKYKLSGMPIPAAAFSTVISIMRKTRRPSGDPIARPITKFRRIDRSTLSHKDGDKITAINRLSAMLI